jgi:hypothetical protein
VQSNSVPAIRKFIARLKARLRHALTRQKPGPSRSRNEKDRRATCSIIKYSVVRVLLNKAENFDGFHQKPAAQSWRLGIVPINGIIQLGLSNGQ